MRKDWLVWVCCFLLFAAGAVWAQVPIPVGFFKIHSAKDMLDMLSSVVVMVGVAIAYKELVSWKEQHSETANDELARTLLFELANYGASIWHIRGIATQCMHEGRLKENFDGSVQFREGHIDRKKLAIQASQEAKVRLKKALIEYESIHGTFLEASLQNIYDWHDMCARLIGEFLDALRSGGTDYQAMQNLKIMSDMLDERLESVYSSGTNDVGDSLEPVMKKLRSKLLR